MKSGLGGFRVALVGASTLLGKELLTVLGERQFPFSQLLKMEVEVAEEAEPETPILDLSEPVYEAPAGDDAAEADLDFVFLATRPRPRPSLLDRIANNGEARTAVIDLTGTGHEELPARDWLLSVPPLPGDKLAGWTRGEPPFFASAHPAVIVISSLLLRLAAHFPIKTAVAQVLCPASENGPRGIEELQKQTVNLLSFHRIPTATFGAQLAFNLLPRLSRARRGGTTPYCDALTDIEARIRRELRQYLGDRIPLPAVRLVQAPVFFSLAFSLYVETAEPAAPEAVGHALAGDRIHVRRFTEVAPSPVEATETGDILVDAVLAESGRPSGLWIWAAADNMRLAAANAVEIAENLRGRIRS
ncbi:MAG TPA: Asd/ArgC dimerization domain-containing protein [Terriglobia bacterium]|nr:Asd/ArgC dimerization domain-containing protein [Terriglobia bacterium]